MSGNVGAVKYFVAVVFAVVCLWLIGAIKLPDPGLRRRLGWNERFSGAESYAYGALMMLAGFAVIQA